MEEFIARYTKMFGEYNDESNTKVYALEYIIETLKANPAAIDNVEEFKKTMDSFSAPNIYMKGDRSLKYVGMTSFGQKRTSKLTYKIIKKWFYFIFPGTALRRMFFTTRLEHHTKLFQ